MNVNRSLLFFCPFSKRCGEGRVVLLGTSSKKNMVHWKRKMLLDSPPPKPSARCMSWSPQASGAALYFFCNNALMRPPKRPLMVAPLCLEGAATGMAVGCASTVAWGTSSLTGTLDVVHVFL